MRNDDTEAQSAQGDTEGSLCPSVLSVPPPPPDDPPAIVRTMEFQAVMPLPVAAPPPPPPPPPDIHSTGKFDVPNVVASAPPPPPPPPVAPESEIVLTQRFDAVMRVP